MIVLEGIDHNDAIIPYKAVVCQSLKLANIVEYVKYSDQVRVIK